MGINVVPDPNPGLFGETLSIPSSSFDTEGVLGAIGLLGKLGLGGTGKTSQSVQQNVSQQAGVSANTLINVSSPESSLYPGTTTIPLTAPSMTQSASVSQDDTRLPLSSSLGVPASDIAYTPGVDAVESAGLFDFSLDNPLMIIGLIVLGVMFWPEISKGGKK